MGVLNTYMDTFTSSASILHLVMFLNKLLGYAFGYRAIARSGCFCQYHGRLISSGHQIRLANHRAYFWDACSDLTED